MNEDQKKNLKHSRNEYKKSLKSMNFAALTAEYQRLNTEIIKGNQMSSSLGNPYTDHINMKMLQYMRNLVTHALFVMVKP